LEKNKVLLKGKNIIGKRILILGEVGSGKTKLAARLLEELMEFSNPKEITVIDLAPQRIGNIGGKISDYTDSINEVMHLSPKNIYMPRLTGTSREQILKYAELNRELIEPLISDFVRKTTNILIINDVTLYLHAGELKRVLKCVKLAETFLATAYYGSKLAEDRGARISIKERQSVEKLATYMDQVIEINQEQSWTPKHFQ
jgi:GTPase SAR1 family protein